MPKWPWQKSAAQAAPPPTTAPSVVYNVNFLARVVDGSIGGTVKVTMSRPHNFVPSALGIAIQDAVANVFAPATMGAIDIVVARAAMDLYQLASKKYRESEGKDPPGFQIVSIVIERKQLGSEDDG